MPLASLFALVLMTADTAPAPAALPDQPIPAGAPADDYGLVSWCTGALTGHMALYQQVKPELDALPDPRPKETAVLDAEQIKAGNEYLALYKKATDAAEKASPRPIAERGKAMQHAGDAIWTGARNTTDGKARMWTWLGWELPGRCETAAERLYEKSLLNAQALGIDLIGGSSAASQKPVTPRIDGARSKDTRAKAAAAKRQTPSQSGAADTTNATAALSTTSPTDGTDATRLGQTAAASPPQRTSAPASDTQASLSDDPAAASQASTKTKLPPQKPEPTLAQKQLDLESAYEAQLQGLPLRTAPPEPAPPAPAAPVDAQPAGSSGPGA